MAYEKVIEKSNEALNLEDDRLLILAGIDNKPNRPGTQGPSNFPVTLPRSHRSPTPVSSVNPYRIPPKIQGTELGTGANPTGADGGDGNAEFDDNCTIPKKQQSQESKTSDYDHRLNSQKKKILG